MAGNSSRRSRANNIELVAWDVSRVVTNLQTGKKLTLLDNISLVIRPREFVCLLGPSGSGKSTLMNILCGRSTPDDGVVLLNGQDLHARLDALKQDIALVPQTNVMYSSLSVDTGLWYTARLRLPPDLSKEETRDCIDETPSKPCSWRPGAARAVKNLSGGQVKRASLANEILCKPTLLFLDEVTSGLDERTDRDMMQLFREMANGGKTVVCVTHSLANVEANCTLVVILTPGGKLAFVGKPIEALQYFKIDRLGNVYTLLENRDAALWQQEFIASPYYQTYVANRMPKGQQPEHPEKPPDKLHQQLRVFFRQSLLLVGRYCAIWKSSPAAIATMLGQPILVAALLILLFGDVKRYDFLEEKLRSTESLLFLLAVTSFWFGCNNAAKEVVKERIIFTRERDFNLLAGSYYISKVAVLVAFAAVQVVILFGAVKWMCNLPGDTAPQFLTVFMLAVAGTTLGLFLSVVAPSEDVAVSLIPVAVIPQVILAGGIAPIVNDFATKWLARLCITTYWGKRAFDSTLPTTWLNLAADPPKPPPSMPPSPITAEVEALTLALVMIGVHALLYSAATIVVFMAQGRGASRIMANLRKAFK